MIDPKPLNPDNGFVEGCVVEYQYHAWGGKEVMTFHAFFVGISENRMVIRDWEGRGESYCDLIESIRPLTGPMAIWNFAPEWATACSVGKDGIGWLENPAYEMVGLPGWTKRPFWANRKPQ